jgi:NAD+ kinase
MIAGIIGNTNKLKGTEFIFELVNCLHEAGIQSILSDSLIPTVHSCANAPNIPLAFENLATLGSCCDFIISAGGDGTLLASAVTAYEYDKPIVGVNLGKLGFLAEIGSREIKDFIANLKENKYTVDERTVLEGLIENHRHSGPPMLAFNDIVIDKGGWPKMIEQKLFINDMYVNTFTSDGLIIATPAGSTGYSLSVGGPIVAPGAKVITLSPISAHSLTIRPLVINNDDSIKVEIHSPHNVVQINCDGQHVHEFHPPVVLRVQKRQKSLKLLRTNSFNYYEILRNKLFWGADIRTMNHLNGEK